jgi:AraC-like DNA-binding protein
MRQKLEIPAAMAGMVWRYGDVASANRRHTHAELELNVVVHGEGTYLLGSRRYSIRRGDMIWLFPSQEHVLIEQSSEFSMWIGVFRHKLVQRAAGSSEACVLTQSAWDGDPCKRMARDDLRRLDDLLEELTADTKETQLLNAGLEYLLLYAWRCFRRAAEMPVHDLHPAVERAARMLTEQPSSLTLPQVARKAGLSAARLSRLFKQQTGSSTTDFRNRQRLDRYLEIFGDGQRYKMLDAALEAGFGSYPQFHRVFVKLVGCTPSAYHRRQI